VIVQFGGQTPLNLALPLKAAGVNIIGTSPESIDLAEDRKRFGKLLDELEIPQAPGAMAASVEAIFLSTFVLISQNRAMAATDKRDDLDLHINLLAEHEVTKLIVMVAAIAEKLQVRTGAEQEIGEITKDVAPDAVLSEIEKQ